MADPLSVAASIAGLLSLADSAFRGVFRYSKAVSNAQDDIKALCTELRSVASVLHGVKLLAETMETDTQRFSQLRLEHVNSCRSILDEILRRIDRFESGSKGTSRVERAIQSLKWPFSKSRTSEMVTELSHQKSTLQLALQASTMEDLMLCLSNMKVIGDKVDHIHKRVESLEVLTRIHLDKERTSILDFFMIDDPSPNLRTSWDLRQPLTGMWLTESPRSRQWLTEPRSKIWLSGIPGAGKTVLAGAVIREALGRLETEPNVGVAFFFCDYKKKTSWEICNILRALAAQLGRQSDSAFEVLKQCHDKIQPRSGVRLTPGVEDLRDLLIRQTEEFDQVLIVVDGLDECGDKAGEVSMMLSEVVRYAATVSMALSSRHEADIKDHLEDDFDHIPIAAHTEDVSLYVGAELEKRIDQKRLRLGDAKLKDEIMSRLIDGAKGMFRWVACQLDALCECPTDADRHAALHELPKDLPETYERILDRINQRHGRVQRLVRHSLKLIAIEERKYKLTIAQLCQAVSIPDERGSTLHRRGIVKGEEISRSCSSFIRRSTDGKFFEFSHFSVREYLQDSALLQRSDLAPYHISDREIYQSMAVQSLRFILLGNFDQHFSSDLRQEIQFMRKTWIDFPFYRFAAMHWPMLAHHAGATGTCLPLEILDLEKRLLHRMKSGSYKRWLITFRLHLGMSYDREIDDFDVEFHEDDIQFLLGRYISTLHIAAGLNLYDVGTWLIEGGTSDLVKTRAPTVLDFAVAGTLAFIYGAESDVSKIDTLVIHKEPRLRASLLACGGSISSHAFWNAKMTMFQVSWFIAKRYGSYSSVQCVLEGGWLLRPEDISESQRQLPFDDEFDETSTFDFVVYLNRSETYKTELGSQLCALIWNHATQLGYKFTNDKSLLPGKITMSEEALYHTVTKAIDQDDLATFKWCERHPGFSYHKIANANEDNCSLLHVAVQCAAEEIMEYMISVTGYNIDVLDSRGRTPLHYDVGGRVHTHKVPDEDGPLKMLIAAGASLAATDNDGWNAFHHVVHMARYYGDTGKLRVLLQHQARGRNLFDEENPDELMAPEPTPIGTLDCSDDISALDRLSAHVDCCSGETCVWGLAASAGFTSVIQTLVEAGFPGHEDCSKGNPLHSIGYKISFEAFKLLLSVHPTSLHSQKDGQLPVMSFLNTCISNALDCNYESEKISVEVVRALLEDSPRLPLTFPQALELCCALIRGTTSIERKMEILVPFLDYGFDTHPVMTSPSILRQSCQFLCKETVLSRVTEPGRLPQPPLVPRVSVESPRSLMSLILGQVDVRKLNQLDAAGFSILHTLFGRLDADKEWLILELVKRGADVNIRDGTLDRNTPLLTHLCASSFDSATVLLNAGADPTLTSPNSWNAAQAAIARGGDMFLERLLECSKVSSLPFDWNRLANVTDATKGEQFTGLNVLHLAAWSGSKACFDILVNERLYTDIQSISRQGYNCMHFATWIGSVPMIEHLHKLGVWNNQAGTDGSTPLHMAVRANKSSAVRKLLDLGSPVVEDIVGVTPSVLAERMNLKDIVAMFPKSNDPLSIGSKRHQHGRRHSQ